MRAMQKNLMVVIILGIVAATFISGFTSLLSFTSIGKDRSNEVLRKELEISAGYLDSLCMDVEERVLSMSQEFERELPPVEKFREPEGETYLEWAKVLARAMVGFDDKIAAVYYRINPEIATPTTGFFLSKTAKINEILECEPTDLSLYAETDAEHVAWFYVPKAAGEPIWVSQYLNLNNGILTISYCKPIFAEDGTFVGVVGVDIDMTKVYQQVYDIRIYETGFAALLSQDGKLLYSDSDMNIPDNSTREILSHKDFLGSYVQQQRRMTLLSRQLRYGDFLLISIADEDLYVNENRVIFSIIIITLVVSILIIAGLTGMLNRMFHRFRTDVLTKTRNRSAYMDTVSVLDEEIRTRKIDFTIISFDLNGLKRLNDTQGHVAGDVLLSHAAADIRKFFPREDIYRIGGDEFVILSKRHNQASLSYALDKFNREMEDRSIRYANGSDLVIFSTGSARFNEERDHCYEDVFRRADRDMYANKAKFYQRHPDLDRRNRAGS